MGKKLLFVLACSGLTGLAFAAFQLLGQYAFLLMLVITIAVLIHRVGKSKFGKKK